MKKYHVWDSYSSYLKKLEDGGYKDYIQSGIPVMPPATMPGFIGVSKKHEQEYEMEYNAGYPEIKRRYERPKRMIGQ